MNRGPTETSLLDEMRRGDPGALGRLFAVVYDQLHDIARTQGRRRPGSETLTTTALVHEAFIKLFGSETRDFSDRAHFMAVAATAMREILVGHARRNAAAKRGGGQAPASFEEVERALASESGFVTPKADALLALDRAVERLHQHSERQSHIVECRFFGGMSIEETATALGISPATVKRDWSMAQAWLHRELQRDVGTRGEDLAAAIEWSELEALWEMVHELPADQRDALLASRRVDGALRQELDSLLDRASAAEAFFDRFLSVVPEAGHAAAIDGMDAGAPVDALPPPDRDPLLGSTLGHYHIVERLGQGGMGVVYRALDLRLHRTVALKLLRAHTPHDPRAKERLLVEARAAAALDHPNICTIYEVGETPEMSAFIAMAFYPGRTLEQALEPGPLPVATALDYATQIARGLGAAHERGIIHRDVKPANIIVTADGVAKLLDFGIARLPDVDVSREGVTPGTIAYMSPEQVTSRALDRRTDLWSLGVLLYEMVSGERPFRGESAGAVLYAILQESPPPVSTVRDELSGHLDSVIARLLAKDRDLRYGKAEELIADLTEIREGRAAAKGLTHGSPASEAPARDSERDDDDSIMPQEPVPATPRRRWGRRAWYGAAAVALGAGIVSSWPLVLDVARGGEQRSARPPDAVLSPQRMAAMDLLAQARRDVLFRTDSGRQVARDLFKAAIAADSTYAAAHAGLALIGLTPGNHNPQSLASAEESARTAVRLDSLAPEAHVALGRILGNNYRFAEAEVHLTRAIELDGVQTQFREFLIWLYVWMDRPRDVLEQAEQFERSNPGAPNAIAELARGLLVNGRCDEALAQLDQLERLQPPPARAGNIAAQCHAVRKHWPQAIVAIQRTAATNERAIPYLGYMLARAGQSDSARTIRDTLLARQRRGEGSTYELAVVYAGFGDFDSAFQWLDQAYDDRSLRPDIMEPLFEDLRGDPRFDKLREKLGIQKR